MNKKTIKQFLKPDWRKIFILVLLFVLSSLLYERFLSDLAVNNQSIIIAIIILLVGLPYGLVCYIIGICENNTALPEIAKFLFLLLGILITFIWYFLACLIISINNKFKTKK